ncbi:MAG: YggS family pyridoxal phosphate-dependent enzyme [Paracoccaceae bacterium]
MSLQGITERLQAAERANGRKIGSTKLIAVSKVQPNERVHAVLSEGHRVFGENRVQEALGKWPAFKEAFGGVELHLIGPLQSNKTRQAMELFDAIHSVDRPKLSTSIARIAQELGRCPEIFIQVNTGLEPQKAGILPQDADAFVKDCRALDLPLKGVMCIPPAEEDPAHHFALLAKIAENNGLSGLSMGMSGDFELAVAHGATHIRVGSAIFGDRVSGGGQ